MHQRSFKVILEHNDTKITSYFYIKARKRRYALKRAREELYEWSRDVWRVKSICKDTYQEPTVSTWRLAQVIEAYHNAKVMHLP